MKQVFNAKFGLRALVVAAAIFCGFYGAQAMHTAQTAMAAEGSKKVFRIAVASDPTSLDPLVQLSEESLAYGHWIFDPLIRWTKDMKMEPRLAEKWEQIDPTTWRFYLRKGVKFHSGNDFTAKDVVFTLDRLKVAQDYKALYEPFTGAKIIDDYTVDITTAKPYGLVLNLATYMFIMDSKFYSGKDEKGQDKALVNKTGPSFANDNASGTGPYMVVSRAQGQNIQMKAFPAYWGTHGNIDEFDLKVIKEDATRVAALLSNAVDMIMPVPTQDYERLSGNKSMQLITMGSSRVITIQLNQQKSKALANPKVRAAIIAATDNQGIVNKIMKGRTVIATQNTPDNMAGHASDLKPRYNLAEAKKLLKEAGYEKGLELTMIAPNNRYINDEKIAQAFVSMMAKIDVKVSLKTMPRTQYWDEFDARVADIQMLGWHPDTEDAANYSEYLLMCPDTKTGYGQYNSNMYCNKKLDELTLATQTETDAAKRTAMLQDIERMAYNDSVFVPLHYEPHAWAGKATLKNLSDVLNSMNFPYFGDLVME